MITPIPLLVFVTALTIVLTTSFHVEGQVWPPCGIRGGTSLPRASRARVSMKHCFLNSSIFLAFNDVMDMMEGEYRTRLLATINPAMDDTSRRRNELGVTFLCRGLLLMNSFIHELDHAGESLVEVDVTTLKHRFVLAHDLLNTSLVTMITRCPLLAQAPIQLEEVDTQASVSLLPAASSASNWMQFLSKIQEVLNGLWVGRFTGTDSGNCQSYAEDMLCVKRANRIESAAGEEVSM